MIQVWLLIGFTIFFLVVLVGYQEAKVRHLQNVIAWCDRREEKITPLYAALDALRKARLPVSSGLNGMFLGNIPSKPAVTGEMVQALKEQNDAIRKVFSTATNMAKEAVVGLEEFERTDRVPVKNFPF